jgi:preprotein translocase subunit SecE
MGFFQYLKDTRGELRYVAWPTRFQTIVYTAIVILLSFLVALYLGLFDFIFTNGLRNVLEVLPQTSATPSTVVSDVQFSTSTPTTTQ